MSGVFFTGSTSTRTEAMTSAMNNVVLGKLLPPSPPDLHHLMSKSITVLVVVAFVVMRLTALVQCVSKKAQLLLNHGALLREMTIALPNSLLTAIFVPFLLL